MTLLCFLAATEYDPRVSSLDRQKAIDRIAADVPPAFGKRLVCLAAYGSGVTEAFIPGTSDLNVAIVLDRVGLDDLKILQRWLPAWRKLGVATPLLVDVEYLERACDVFPIELGDIRAAHRLLAGDDVFATLHIHAADLRRQLEQEARAKLLRLRVAYAEAAGAAEVEALMHASVKSFLVIMRGVVRLQTGAAPEGLLALIEKFEELNGADLAGMRSATRVRLGHEKWSGATDAAFAAYLADAERLVAVVDRLYADGAPGRS